jgi:hypothetical protein
MPVQIINKPAFGGMRVHPLYKSDNFVVAHVVRNQ